MFMPYRNHWSVASPAFAAVQELLGHKDVETAMIYTHVLNRRGRAVQSPLDRLRKPVSVERAAG